MNKTFYETMENTIIENKEIIEKLEKQNARYKKAKRKLQQENKQLKSRIVKALVFISDYRNYNVKWYEFTIDDKLELLQILKGEENE